MIWAYKAATREGKIVEGLLEAKSVNEAVGYLRSRDFIPIKVSENSKKNLISGFGTFKKYKSSDLILFTRQLSSMLTSGLTLMQAFVIIKDQTTKENIKNLVQGIIGQIEEGKTFAVALQAYPDMFSPIYIALIKAGETSGILDKLLLRLADNLEKEQKLKSQLKAALIYPIIVIVMMVGVMVVMLVAVFPQLTKMYKDLNVSLPFSTQILIGLSNFLINFWYIPILVIGFGVILYRRWKKTETGELIMADIILKIPIFGKLIQETILAEIARTLGLLVGTGTLIVPSFKQAADVAGNRIYKNAMLEIADRVEKGITVGEAMGFYVLFPPLLVQMVKIGEQTGKLDDSLIRASEYFEREAEMTIKALTTAIEPLIMLVLGIGVAFLIISIITPIYNLTSSFR